jgi:membrane-associated protease RseP (regulator of RpoE activity)
MLKRENKKKAYTIQAALFIVTFIFTTLAGAEWSTNRMLFWTEETLTWNDFLYGLNFSIPFLGILTVHEFGHYIVARLNKIRVTLPYYIPFWWGFIAMPSIGTMGAFIRIKEMIKTRREYFDVGIAGPLAGFVVALGVLYYGFTHLPPPEHIFDIHPEYEQYGLDYPNHVYQEIEGGIKLGDNLLFKFFKTYVADPERLPNNYELMHYPWIFAGYLALFFTALNLFPIGQLDGGHVIFGLFGRKNHSIISSTLFILFVLYSGFGVITPYDDAENLLFGIPLYIGFLYFVFYTLAPLKRDRLMAAVGVFAVQFLTAYFFPHFMGSTHWLLFAFIIGRFLGIHHPPALYNEPLNWKRKLLGMIALIVFVVSFTPTPFES